MSPKKLHVKTTYEASDCRKLHKQLSNSCHRSGKGHVRQSVSFWPETTTYNVFGQRLLHIMKRMNIIFSI